MTPHNTTPTFNDIDYKIGDILVIKDHPNKEIGKCTGFLHNNTCVEIDGKAFQSVCNQFLMDLLGEELPNPRKQKTQVQRITIVEGIMVRLRWRVKTRHKWRIKRMKHNRRLTKHKKGNVR
jgi:hypothetical protein